MNLSTGWMAVAAASALLLGLWLMRAGRDIRRRRGLGDGRTIDLDSHNLYSRRYGLDGRPDRLVKDGGAVIPEEWKSSKQPRPWHRLQLWVYFLLMEEASGNPPPHGFLVCGDGTRHRVENTDELRTAVLDLVRQIRAARANVAKPIPVAPVPGQCRPCGMRGPCGQATL